MGSALAGRPEAGARLLLGPVCARSFASASVRTSTSLSETHFVRLSVAADRRPPRTRRCERALGDVECGIVAREWSRRLIGPFQESGPRMKTRGTGPSKVRSRFAGAWRSRRLRMPFGPAWGPGPCCTKVCRPSVAGSIRLTPHSQGASAGDWWPQQGLLRSTAAELALLPGLPRYLFAGASPRVQTHWAMMAPTCPLVRAITVHYPPAIRLRRVGPRLCTEPAWDDQSAGLARPVSG